jgi:hypothetical protein
MSTSVIRKGRPKATHQPQQLTVHFRISINTLPSELSVKTKFPCSPCDGIITTDVANYIDQHFLNSWWFPSLPISCYLRKPKSHFHIHNSFPLASTLYQIIQGNLSHSLCLGSTLIISSYLHLDLQNGSSIQFPQPNTCTYFCFYVSLVDSISSYFDFIALTIFGALFVTKRQHG